MAERPRKECTHPDLWCYCGITSVRGAKFSFRFGFGEGSESQEWIIHEPVERLDFGDHKTTAIGISGPDGIVPLSTSKGKEGGLGPDHVRTKSSPPLLQAHGPLPLCRCARPYGHRTLDLHHSGVKVETTSRTRARSPVQTHESWGSFPSTDT